MNTASGVSSPAASAATTSTTAAGNTGGGTSTGSTSGSTGGGSGGGTGAAAGPGIWGQLGAAALGTGLQIAGNAGNAAAMNAVNGPGQQQAQGQSEDTLLAGILLQLIMGFFGGGQPGTGQPTLASAQSRSSSALDNIERGRKRNRSRSANDSNEA